MSLDFLWQEALIFGGGLSLARTQKYLRTRILHRRLVSFFGADAVSIVVPVLGPLTSDNFEHDAAKTMAHRTGPSGQQELAPVHGEILHLDDYRASEEVAELLRRHGGQVDGVLADTEALGRWSDYPNVVGIGSPRTNAALAEVIGTDPDDTGSPVTEHQLSDTLDSYRVEVVAPVPFTVGVETARALGVITRLRNPADRRGWIVGVWGCRAESTLATARYLRQNFKEILTWTRPDQPLVVLLAVRGPTLGLVEPMFAASDAAVMFERPKLLGHYLRTAPGPTTTS